MSPVPSLVSFRRQLELPRRTAYLNTAATSPTSKPVLRAMAAYEHDRARRAEGGWDDWVANVEKAKRTTGAYFRARADEVAFLSNTGHGINTVANMINWNRGDNVVTTALEFPSNRYPWLRLEGRGVKVRSAAPGADGFLDANVLEQLITDRTRLVALSWVAYLNGQRLPIRRIADAAHAHGAWLMVDSIQGAGAVRPDFRGDGIDFLANGGHKWLMAPFGVGALFVRRELIENIDPPFPGWMSAEDPDAFGVERPAWAVTARRFEAGNLNYGGIEGWRAALEVLRARPEIPRRVLALSSRVIDNALAAGLRVWTPPDAKDRAGIVVVGCRRPQDAAKRLAEKDIQVSVRGNGLRASPHFWNTEDEVDRFVSELARIEGKV